MCSRPETWPQKFGAGLKELLPVRERLAQRRAGVRDGFVSSDATRQMIGAIDWTNGVVMRMKAGLAAVWVQRCSSNDEVLIHAAEMLSFLAFACKVGQSWSGRVVLYGGDNQIVREWISSRKAGTAVGRLLARILNLVEMRYRVTLIASWWRTYHNIHADLITRCSDKEFEDLVAGRGRQVVDVTEALQQAVRDSERFGPCLLAWEEEDRTMLMQLKERRLHRAIPSVLKPTWGNLCVVELCGTGRRVLDFVDAARAAGGHGRSASWRGPVEEGEVVMASFPPDQHGKVPLHAVAAAVSALAVFEGPSCVPWDCIAKEFDQCAWNVTVAESLSSEFGEASVRRRKCVAAAPRIDVSRALESTTLKGTIGPPVGAVLRHTKQNWIIPERLVIDAGIPRNPLLPALKGHFWRDGVRCNLVSSGGPIRWPLREGEGVQECVVWDSRGPQGAVRRLSKQEIWCCQGRSVAAWRALIAES